MGKRDNLRLRKLHNHHHNHDIYHVDHQASDYYHDHHLVQHDDDDPYDHHVVHHYIHDLDDKTCRHDTAAGADRSNSRRGDL